MTACTRASISRLGPSFPPRRSPHSYDSGISAVCAPPPGAVRPTSLKISTKRTNEHCSRERFGIMEARIKTETFWNVQDKAAGEGSQNQACSPSSEKIKDRKDERLMEQTIFDRKAYAAKAREAVAEGSVLLRNEAPYAALSCPGHRLAVFGRSQFNSLKKGPAPRIGEHRACSRDFWKLEQSGGVQIDVPVKCLL